MMEPTRIMLVASHSLVQSKDAVKSGEKDVTFSRVKRNLYAGYDLRKALNSASGSKFLAPIVYASEHEKGHRKLVQQNKYSNLHTKIYL